MKQITCNVITDLLELYADKVVSEDTKKLVAEHLRGCAKCEEKLSQIKQNLNIPVEVNTEPIKRIKRKIKKKIIVVSLISVFVVAAILLGAFFFITLYKTAIPYEKTHIYSVEQGDDEWALSLKFMDNIDEYTIMSKPLDETTMEYYIFFYDTYHTRLFSNRAAVNDYISIPAYSESITQGIGSTKRQTVRIYYCIFKKPLMNGKIDFSERYLIWEKQPEQAEVAIDYGNSAIYSEEDMNAAINIIKDEFNTWEGCKLSSITYASDDNCNFENIAWMNQLATGHHLDGDFTQCILFKSDFYPSKNGGEAWDAEEYTDWQWWLARAEDGEWKLLTWGY